MEFASSDLAAECAVKEGCGVRIQHSCAEECEITHVRIESEEAALRVGKPQGRYVSVECGNLCELDERREECVTRVLSVEIRELARRMCEKRVGANFSVLVAGLGNAEMTPDALGPKTVKILPVTRHLHHAAPGDFATHERCALSAISPGVTAQTGMETAELLRGAVAVIQPDLVIAVDALAARSPERLASTVQLCDSGIRPGGGIGNARCALTLESVGVPVMAIGVPTVINCTTLLVDALPETEAACAAQTLKKMRSLFVCPKEIDLLVGRAALLLSKALEKAFHA